MTEDQNPGASGVLSPADLRHAAAFLRSWQSDDHTDATLLAGMSDAGIRRLVTIVAEQCEVTVDPDPLDRADLEKSGMIPLESIRTRLGVRSERIIPLVEELQRRRRADLARVGLDAEERERTVAGYITIVPPRSLGRTTYRYLSAEARDDLVALVAERYPARPTGRRWRDGARSLDASGPAPGRG